MLTYRDIKNFPEEVQQRIINAKLDELEALSQQTGVDKQTLGVWRANKRSQLGLLKDDGTPYVGSNTRKRTRKSAASSDSANTMSIKLGKVAVNVQSGGVAKVVGVEVNEDSLIIKIN